VVVVAGISAVLISLFLPALQMVRAGHRSRECQNNLRQLALAAQNYRDVYGFLPPGMDSQYVGTLIYLLPFLDQDILYRNFSFDPAYSLYWQNPYNLPPTDGTDNVPRPPDVYGSEWDVRTFLCPEAPRSSQTVTGLLAVRYGTPGVDYRADDGLDNGHVFVGSPGRLVLARSHYLGMGGDYRRDPPYDNGKYRGIFTYNSRTRYSDITDGASNTIMFAESWGGNIDWQGDGGVPSGWSTNSRSAGFNYSTFGTCPSGDNPNCDLHSFGLSFGTFGALHPLHTSGGTALGFNVAFADGSVRLLRGDIDFSLWDALCGKADGEIHPSGLAPDVAGFEIE
jgi:prepilin-type processing-associated H-X9-DG protein